MQRTKLLFFSLKVNSKLSYVLQTYSRLLNFDEVCITDDLQRFIEEKCCKINYSNHPIPSANVTIRPHAYLYQNWKTIDITEIRANFLAYFSSDSDIRDIDIFAATFFLLSRHEEYLISDRDSHGRFMAESSVLFPKELYLQPIVNQWVMELWQKLSLSSELGLPPPCYDYCFTYDIDRAWKWKHIDWWKQVRMLGAKVLRLNFKLLRWHIGVLFGNRQDPNYTFDEINRLHHSHPQKVKFFFLLSSNTSSFDENNTTDKAQFRQLLKTIAQKYDIGIHPSYFSSSWSVLEQELSVFEQITNKKATNSRQHFLRMKLPDTYRKLIQGGIKIDFTMGYAETIGFRAGISTPFFWFDLEKDEVTDLLVVPFCVMDVSLKNYLKLTPQEGQDKVLKIIETLKKSGGVFCSLWHNSSLSELDEWGEWKAVYTKIIQAASS